MPTTSSVSRTVRLCRWQARVNSLWLWVYCILTLGLQAYLLYRAVIRCKQYNELPWRTEQKPVVELYVYIALIVLSVMCVPFFIITSIFKVGNYSGDGVRFGRDNIHEQELAEAAAAMSISGSLAGSSANLGTYGSGDNINVQSVVSPKKTLGARLRLIWRHAGPFCHGFHVLSAFSLLLPSILLEAQEIRYGFRNPAVTWSSELDILFGKYVFKEDTSRNYFVTYGTEETTSAALETEDDQIPIVPSNIQVNRITSISPEFVNYFSALILYGIRYAAVFWYTKMSFSLVFVFQMLIITLHFLFSFCGAGILYKFEVNNFAFPDFHFVLPASVSLVLFLLADAFLFLSSLAIFKYGYQHYLVRWHKFLQTYAPLYYRNCKQVQQCQGYSPHLVATVILLLVILCRGAIVYEYVVVYRRTGLPVILGNIVIDAVYMVSWIALWFALTIKQNWNFQIMLARYVQPSGVRQPSISSLNNQFTNKANVTEDRFQPSHLQPVPVDGAISSHATLLTVDVDIANNTDLQDSHSPQGVLIKENNRKSASSQRVKFEEGTNKASDNSNHKSRNQNKEPNAFRRTYSDSVSHRRRRKDSSDEYTTESTPENTLTRSYRHSIRDKCGQYYVTRDLSPLPAAQSSPCLTQEKTEQNPEKPRSDEILLNSVLADNLNSPNNPLGKSKSDNIISQNYSPRVDNSVSNAYTPDDANVQLRPSKLHVYPRQPDMRYSYPITTHPVGHQEIGYYDHPGYSSNFNSPHIPSNRDPVRHSHHFDRPPPYPSPPVHDGSYLASKSRSPGKLQGNKSKPAGNKDHSRQSSGIDVHNDTVLPTPPRPPRRSMDQSAGPPRRQRIDSNKLNLSRRDSALPSSNETSSNDSNDVLCSQV